MIGLVRHSCRKFTQSIKKPLVLLCAGIMYCNIGNALTFNLPENGNIVGGVQSAAVLPGDTLSTIGRRYDIGGYEMKEANPGVPYLHPKPGSQVIIPSAFILPSAPRKGIVINLAEMRLYYYHADGTRVSTYPIGIGQQGWLTPTGTSTIVRKRENPWWIVPDSILENHARNGKPIEPKWPPGPDNPLGPYAMNTGFKNIVIHGTPYPMGVGVRSSHGCIRMLNEDISQLYSMAPVGTSVTIVHESHKVGNMGNKIYLEVHQPLSEPVYRTTTSFENMVRKLVTNNGYSTMSVQWEAVQNLQKRASGFPQFVGMFQ